MDIILLRSGSIGALDIVFTTASVTRDSTLTEVRGFLRVREKLEVRLLSISWKVKLWPRVVQLMSPAYQKNLFYEGRK